MKFFKSLTLLLAVTCSNAMAGDWRSPVEAELNNTKPEIYQEYYQARTLLDGYQGERTHMRQAFDLLLGIQKKDRNLAPVLRELGRLYIIASHFGGDQFDERTLKIAEDSILRSISVAPKYEDAYVLLGHLYTKMNQYDKAIDALNQAETLGSKSPWLSLNLADVYVKTKRLDVAMTLVQDIIDSQTSNVKAEATAHQLKINIHSSLANKEGAKKAHEALLLAQPNVARHWGNYASLLLYSFSDAESAVTAADKALFINDYQGARYTKALALYMQWADIVSDPTRKDEALLIFEKASSYFPDQALVVKAARRRSATHEMSKTLEKYLETNKP